MSQTDIAAVVAAVIEAMNAKKPASKVSAVKVEKPKASRKPRSPRKPKAEQVAKPKAEPKTYDQPFAVKVQFTKTGGLVMHGGARVFYRPEGDEAAQIAWLKANGLDAPLYLGLVKSEKHKTVWLTYTESKAL